LPVLDAYRTATYCSALLGLVLADLACLPGAAEPHRDRNLTDKEPE
jgi:hypothetical protein